MSTDGYTPTTEQVREHFRELSDTVSPGTGDGNVEHFDAWLTDHDAKVRVAQRTRMGNAPDQTSVFMIEYTFEDGGRYPVSRVNEDFGWFSTREKAQAVADGLNQPEVDARARVKERQIEDTKRNWRVYEMQMREHRILVQNGIKRTEPRKPHTTVEEAETAAANFQRIYPTSLPYSVIEIEEGS